MVLQWFLVVLQWFFRGFTMVFSGSDMDFGGSAMVFVGLLSCGLFRLEDTMQVMDFTRSFILTVFLQ